MPTAPTTHTKRPGGTERVRSERQGPCGTSVPALLLAAIFALVEAPPAASFFVSVKPELNIARKPIATPSKLRRPEKKTLCGYTTSATPRQA